MRRHTKPVELDRPKGIQECLNHFVLTAALVAIGSLVVFVDVCVAILTLGRSCGPTEH